MSEDPQDQARSRPIPPVETRFKRGQSGNPGGRPKTGASISEALQILVKDGSMPNGKNRTSAWRIAARMLQDAEDGDPRAQVLVLERTEGRLPTPLAERSEVPSGVIVLPAQLSYGDWSEAAQRWLKGDATERDFIERATPALPPAR